jgi:hypothetical protein
VWTEITGGGGGGGGIASFAEFAASNYGTPVLPGNQNPAIIFNNMYDALIHDGGGSSAAARTFSCGGSSDGTFLGTVWVENGGHVLYEHRFGGMTGVSLLSLSSHVAGTRVVVVGSSGHIATSSNDGVSFSTTAPLSANDLNAITNDNAFNAASHVAVGNSGEIVTSDGSGFSWTQRTSGVGDNLEAVTWVPWLSLFVAVGGSATCITSPDGINWTTRTFPSMTPISIDHDGSGLLIATSSLNGTIATSPDGIAWSSSSPATLSGLSHIRIAHNKKSGADSVWVARSRYGIHTSTDGGTTWHAGICGNVSEPGTLGNIRYIDQDARAGSAGGQYDRFIVSGMPTQVGGASYFFPLAEETHLP